MTVCNLKCPTCRVTNTKYKPWFMPLAQFEQLAYRLRSLWQTAQVINLCSSEPLLHKNFFEMVDIVRGYNPRIFATIITNAMLLDDQNTDKIMERGLGTICVSLDGTTKEVFESIRPGSDFELIIKNIKHFIKEGGQVRTILVVQKQNVHQVLDFMDMCHDLGIWMVKFSGLNTYLPEHVPECLYSYEGNPELDQLFQQAKDKAALYGMQIKVRPTKIEDCGCTLPGTMYISPNGEAMPCVFFSEPSQFSLMDKTRITEPFSWGNVYKDDPVKIWQSQESWDFRKNIKYREECNYCGLKYSVVC